MKRFVLTVALVLGALVAEAQLSLNALRSMVPQAPTSVSRSNGVFEIKWQYAETNIIARYSHDLCDSVSVGIPSPTSESLALMAKVRSAFFGVPGYRSSGVPTCVFIEYVGTRKTLSNGKSVARLK